MQTKYILEATAIVYILEVLPHKLMKEAWQNFEEQCESGISITDRETKKVLEQQLTESESAEWVANHSAMFKPITQKESISLGELFKAGVFDFCNNPSLLVRKLPEATPFIIVMADEQDRKLVIHKTCKDMNRIEKICSSLSITTINVEDYLIEINNG